MIGVPDVGQEVRNALRKGLNGLEDREEDEKSRLRNMQVCGS